MSFHNILSLRLGILLTPFRTLRSISKSEIMNAGDVTFDADPIPSNEVNVSGGILSKIDINPDVQRQKINLKPEMFDGSKLLHVALVGKTNVGKSALTNALTGATVSAVSKKIHTTRKITKGVLVDNKTQLVFIDTPGFLVGKKIGKKHKLEKELYRDQENSLKFGEIILVLHDVSNEFSCNRLDSRILHLLYRYRHLPSILVLNKVDLLKAKSKTLDIIHRLTKSRVNGEILMRKQSKVFQMAEKIESQKKMTEIVTAYRAKRLANEKLLKESNNSNKLLSDASQGEKIDTEVGVDLTNETERTVSMFTDLDKSLSKVDWETLEKIITKPLHEVPLNQLRKCFLNEGGWPYFKAVFSVSALHGHGIDRLAAFLVGNAKLKPWKYHSSIITPSNPTELAKEAVRSRMLDRINYYHPYKLIYEITVWEVNEHDTLCILMNVICQSESQVPIILGPRNENIIIIGKEVSQELSNLFGRDVFVKLNVKSSKKSVIKG